MKSLRRIPQVLMLSRKVALCLYNNQQPPKDSIRLWVYLVLRNYLTYLDIISRRKSSSNLTSLIRKSKSLKKE